MSGNGIAPDQDMIQAVRLFIASVGLAGNYRWIICNLCSVPRPLAVLTSQQVQLKLLKELQQAFET